MTRSLFHDSRIRSLKVTGSAELGGALALAGALTTSGGITNSGTATFNDAVVLKSTLATSGTATFAGALNSSGTAIFTTLSTDDVSLPGTNTAVGQPGQIIVPNTGTSFIYCAIATNTWARVALTNTAFA